MLICSPPPAPPVQEYSQPRCGWPCHQRAQAGRSSPVRCPHSASAPAGSACGGARMTTCRAPAASTWWRRRRSHARPAITATAADGQHRARGRTPRGEGAQQQPGQPGGRPAGVGHVPAQRPARPARRDQQPVPGHGSMSSSASPGSGGATAAPAGCWRACRRAISAGSLVHQAFSSGEARASKQTRADGPAASRPVPLAADRSRERSPADRRNSAATLPMACGDWRSRIWVAELAMTARPRSVD